MKQEHRQGRIARAAVAAALSVTMAFGGALAPAAVLADEITIQDATGVSQGTNVGYKGYLVFTATSVDESNKAYGIAWTTDNSIKQAVTDYINAVDIDGTSGSDYDAWLLSSGHITSGSTDQQKASARENVMNAVEFISTNITASVADSGAGTSPETKQARTFADGLAKALANATATATSSGGKISTTDAQKGLWLIVADATTVGSTDEAGTAPIWLAVGNGNKTVTAKAAIPTIAKRVKDDAASSNWGTIADANAGEDLEFQITGTLPANYGAYASYKYVIEDTLGEKLALKGNNTSEVTVSVGGTNKTTNITGDAGSISYENNKLTVTIDDLKTLDSSLTKDSTIVVTYKAHPTTAAASGSNGYNANTAKLTYTADPVNLTTTAEATTSSVNVATYQMTVTKVDKDTREAVNGAKFTVKQGNKYVNANGELQDAEYKFDTGSSNAFTVPRLDEGTYVISETDAATNYDKMADATVVITATKSEGAVTGLSATYSGGNGGTGDGVQGSPAVDTGLVTITLSDTKIVTLPGTGMTSSQLGTIVGAVLIFGGIVVAVRRRQLAAQE